MNARLYLPRDLGQPGDHRVEAVGELGKLRAAVGAHGRRKVTVGDAGRECRVIAYRGLQRLLGGAFGLSRVLQLTMALVGQRGHPPQRQAEAHTRSHQRGGSQADRDLTGVVERADEQDEQRERRGDRRNREARGPVLLSGRGGVGGQPHRRRDQQQRDRPCHRVQEPADVPGVAEQRGDVARGVGETSEGDETPARALTDRQQPNPEQGEAEQQQIPDRVDEVDRHRLVAAAGRGGDRVEGEGDEGSRGDEGGDDAVEVVSGGELAHVALHQHHHADIGQREEPDPQQLASEIVRRGRPRVTHRSARSRPEPRTRSPARATGRICGRAG